MTLRDAHLISRAAFPLRATQRKQYIKRLKCLWIAPFYVPAVKMSLKKEKKSAWEIWQMLERAQAWISKFTSMGLKKRTSQSPGDYLCTCEGRGLGQGEVGSLGMPSPQPTHVREQREPSAKSGSSGFRRKTLLAALSSACCVEHPRTSPASFV